MIFLHLMVSVMIFFSVHVIASDSILEFHKLAASEGFPKAEMDALLQAGVDVNSLTRGIF